MSRKSIWAVVAGFLLLLVLCVVADSLLRAICPAGFGPSGQLQSWGAGIATIVYSAAFSAASSYLTARLAGSRPVTHAMFLGGLLLLLTLVELARSWHLAPVWFNLCFLGMILPSAWLGGLARARQVGI